MRERAEIPLFCEELPLKAPVRWAARLGVLGFVASGVWAGAWGGEALAWLSGLCLTLGSAGAFGLWRLSTFETNVGRYGVRAGCWELAWTFPRADVTSAKAQPARSWRALFAPHEVLVELSSRAGRRRLVIPARDPQELVAALEDEG